MFNPFNNGNIHFLHLVDLMHIENFPEHLGLLHGPNRQIEEMPPAKSSYYNIFVIKIPKGNAHFDIIHKIVDQTLGGIETLTVVYDPCCWRWHLEYSKPHVNHIMDYQMTNLFENHRRKMLEIIYFARFIQKTGFKLSELRAHYVKDYWDLEERFQLANTCAQVAAKKYPHNAIEWDEWFGYFYEDLEPPLLGGPRLWGQYKLCAFQSETTFDLEIISMRHANRSTQAYIYHTLTAQLCDRNFFWEARKNFLMFLECIPINDFGHIPRYIGNDLVARDVLSYLQ